MTPTDGAADGIWYVAYGSNLNRARLQRYLDRSPDPTAATERRVTTLPHRLFFAYESRLWTGGSAFLDPTVDAQTVTHTTAWLLSRVQFRSVLAQENGRPADHDHGLDLDAVPVGGRVAVDDRRYGLVLGCASPDHRPALTFTTPDDPLPVVTRPSEAYVDTIVVGLVDDHGLDERQARAYLRAHIV